MLRRAGAPDADGSAADVDGAPLAGIANGLPLEERVGGVAPHQDAAVEVVENEIAAVGEDRQHGVAFAIRTLDDGHQQGADRPALLDEVAALQQRQIFAVARRGRVGPVFLDAVEFHVGRRGDVAIDLGIDGEELAPQSRRQVDARRRGAGDVALVDVGLAEFVMTDRLRGKAANGHESRRIGLY